MTIRIVNYMLLCPMAALSLLPLVLGFFSVVSSYRNVSAFFCIGGFIFIVAPQKKRRSGFIIKTDYYKKICAPFGFAVNCLSIAEELSASKCKLDLENVSEI